MYFSWTIHPELLTHVDMTSHTIEAGDMVVVRDDERLLNKFKYMCDDWHDSQMTVTDMSQKV